MKAMRYELFLDTTTGIKFIEIIRWFFFYFFLELIFPLFLDPLGLYVEFLGYELDELIELGFFLIIPLMTIYFLDSVSGFSAVLGLFLYLFLTSFPLQLLYTLIVSDFFVFLIFIVFLDDFMNSGESETVNEIDLY